MAFHSLPSLISVLETLAPPPGAAEWDNTGLILEAPSIAPISKILLTLDLTPDVAREAVDLGVNLIISYHPPLFGGIRKIVRSDPLTAPLLDLLSAHISVYSPHTALDAAPEGMSDWLAACFDAERCEPVEGSGRHLTLTTSMTPGALGQTVREYLGLPYIRQALAASGPQQVRTLALCPGAGASILAGLEVDAVITGEMKHHDLLAFTRRGVHVFISEHSHTERPYLKVFRERLRTHLPPDTEILLSQADKDPITLEI